MLIQKFFVLTLDDKKGHRLKLCKRRVNLDVGKCVFKQVCNDWNHTLTFSPASHQGWEGSSLLGTSRLSWTLSPLN